jgi:hypothetical protein
MQESIIKSGLSIHCHHNILVEHCYNYDERVEAIKRDKPQNEQEIRLRLFKLLPKEAIEELPTAWRRTCAEWNKAYAEWCKADAEWHKADAELDKADAEWCKADAEWCKEGQEIWHKKWCGCTNWNGNEIIF